MPVIDQWTGGMLDVVVVGAGAAGLAAARRLMARPEISVLVLEAGDRLGGRAHTVTPLPGVPVDLGCGWLHSALTNAWTHLAEANGCSVDRTPAPWNRDGVDFGISGADDADYARVEASFEHRIEALVATGQDKALGDLVAPDDRWRGLLDAVSTYVSGAELDLVSAIDHERYRPGEGDDWRVVEGYGNLIAGYGASVPIALDAAVTHIDHTGARAVRIGTNRGHIEARAVIVTVSTDVLASGAIAFSPALPEKLQAAADLPLGLADKLFLRLDRAEDFPIDLYNLGSPDRAATGAYHLRPFGRPVIECFYGGALARDLETGGDGAFAAFAGKELVGLFGAGLGPRLTPIAVSAWAGEPFIRGSYSYAKPGKADARAALAAPVDGRLFFAGEATSPERFTTAHGAYESGVVAADAVIGALGKSQGRKARGVCLRDPTGSDYTGPRVDADGRHGARGRAATS